MARSALFASDDLIGVVGSCRGALDRLAAESRAAWTGRAAAGFLGVVADRRRLLEGTLDRVETEAGRLAARADELFAEARRIERLADEMEAAGSLASLAS